MWGAAQECVKALSMDVFALLTSDDMRDLGARTTRTCQRRREALSEGLGPHRVEASRAPLLQEPRHWGLMPTSVRPLQRLQSFR